MHPSFTNVRDEYGLVIAKRRSQLQLELDKILASNATFLWEIGCGHGHFLTAYAATHPKRDCIGIDLVSERIERARRKRARAKLNNLHFLRADARLFLDTLPARPCVSDVFVLFPDPWPKSRHHKHRVLQAEFLVALATRATSDCRLHFRTDYRPYFDDALATVTESSLWELLDVPWPFEFETVFQSRAERHDSFIAGFKPTGS